MGTTLDGHRPYTSIALIPPLLSRSGMLEVLLGTVDGSIIIVDENEAQDQQVIIIIINFIIINISPLSIPLSPPTGPKSDRITCHKNGYRS